ncbi:acyl carrier protein [Roseobacter sp. GAI101]|uniref:acyl carrier protein n=1 Tax=Roseobacter sp. (strain GAI101) TaxID=391589 RepID=UPI00018720FB|nr:phosphopantetheine-binding protein [Roseobacter sp. GAI101]EEB85064.1 conserved hypothetical protein [Roseobacter sp. GAI101]
MTPALQAQTRTVIRSYLGEGLRLGRDLTDDEDLLVSGLLDSLSVVRFVAMLETEFDLVIPPQDITLTNLASIDAVMIYLESRGL